MGFRPRSGGPRDRPRRVDRARSPNAVTTAGGATGDREDPVRVSGAFDRNRIYWFNSSASGRMNAGRHRDVTRGMPTLPSDVRVNGGGQGSPSHAQGRRQPALGQKVARADGDYAESASGIEPTLVRPARHRRACGSSSCACGGRRSFLVSAWSASAEAGAVVASRSSRLAACSCKTFLGSTSANLVGRPHHCLGRLVDDAMITVDTMVTRLELATTGARATFA